MRFVDEYQRLITNASGLISHLVILQTTRKASAFIGESDMGKIIERTKHGISKVGKPSVEITNVPVVIRSIPSGYDWGWYSREDPRMHVQTLDGPESYKVWLEEKGKRVFQPVGKIPRKVLNPLQAKLIDQRQFIEGKWARFMLDQGWLDLHVALPHLTLVAYPQHPGKFTRKIDLRTWFPAEQLGTLRPDIIKLDREMAALRVWSDRSEEQVPYDVRLATLLWQG
jgi:hypothetical protein